MTAISSTLNFGFKSDGGDLKIHPTHPVNGRRAPPHPWLKTVSGRAAYEDVFLSLHNPLRVAISGTMEAQEGGVGPFLKQNSE